MVAALALIPCLSLANALAPLGAGEEPAPPGFPGKQWVEASPESQGVDSRKLQVAFDHLKATGARDGVREVVIVRNGVMVWHGDNIDHRHGVWSMTKSFTSTCLGLLVDDGKCRLETLAKDHLPSMAAYPTVTLRHFTTMTSGYRAKGDEPAGTYRHGPSSTWWLPDPSPLFAPGTAYAYWDSAMNQFGNVLTRIAGEPLEQLFRRRIAEPIGMDPKAWDWGDFGTMDGLVVNGGSGNGDRHMFVTAREVARFGLLYLNRGQWRDRRLISESWVDQATTNQVPTALARGHDSASDGRGCYGYNWWPNGTLPDGRRKWPGATDGTYAASGFNNNDLFIIPEWRMVVVRLGLDEAGHKITDEEYGRFLQLVGEAIER